MPANSNSSPTRVDIPRGNSFAYGGIQVFQPGLGLLALRLNMPILPVYIQGAHQALPKGKWFPRRHPIRVFVGTPLYPLTYQDKQATMTERAICQKIVEDVQAAIAHLREIYTT